MKFCNLSSLLILCFKYFVLLYVSCNKFLCEYIFCELFVIQISLDTSQFWCTYYKFYHNESIYSVSQKIRTPLTLCHSVINTASIAIYFCTHNA